MVPEESFTGNTAHQRLLWKMMLRELHCQPLAGNLVPRAGAKKARRSTSVSLKLETVHLTEHNV